MYTQVYYSLMNTANAIHKAELLRCGCRVSPTTGETFSLCARHACNLAARTAEIPSDPVDLPKKPRGHGMKPICIFCASFRLLPDGANLKCYDCGHTFAVADIKGFALSIDSKPRVCTACNTTHYGACSCSSTQRESI